MISSSPQSTPLPSSSADQFKATNLLRNIVVHIHRNVKQKRRRLIWKGVGPTACFSGSDVCDTALFYLLMDNENFKTTDLTREKARKLCQMLLDHQIFEPLSGGGSSGSQEKFTDNAKKYYKFVSSVDEALRFDISKIPSTSDSGISSCSQDSTSSEGAQATRGEKGRPQSVLIEGVLCNPKLTESECKEDIITELLGLSASENADSVGSNRRLHSTHRTTTEQMKKMYNGHVFINKRASLDCEAAFAHGTLPRTISAGTGTVGVFKRKGSSLNVAGSSGEPDVRRSLRVKTRHTQGGGPVRPPKRPVNSTEATHASTTNHIDNLLHYSNPGFTDDSVIENGSLTSSLTPKSDRSVKKLAKLTGEMIFSPTAIAEIRQEIALSQLSQLLDLSILEGLMCAGNGSSEEPGYHNTVFFNVEQELSMGLNGSDAWLKSAIDVFDYMPNGHRTTFDYQIGVNPMEYKLALYRSIIKNYRGRPAPLLPTNHEQIHLSILSLLMSGEEEKALLAIRLSLLLLPCYLMAELTTLLEFLQVVSTSTQPRLKTSLLSNHDVVLNDFSGIFIGCKMLSMDQRRMLLLLLMRYCDKLSQVPDSVQTTLEKTMQNIKQGNDTPTPSTMFCEKVSVEQYKSQQQQATDQAIISLIKSVVDDTNMPLKEKQKFLKSCSKNHPLIMNTHFRDLA